MQVPEVEESILDTCVTWSQSKLSGAGSEILAPSVRHFPHPTPLISRQAEWGSVASSPFLHLYNSFITCLSSGRLEFVLSASRAEIVIHFPPPRVIKFIRHRRTGGQPCCWSDIEERILPLMRHWVGRAGGCADPGWFNWVGRPRWMVQCTVRRSVRLPGNWGNGCAQVEGVGVK